MKAIRYFRRAVSMVVAFASCMLGFVLIAPSAFALVLRPVGDANSATVAPQTAPATGHVIISRGMAGWEIALIAVAAGLFAATFAVLADRVRGSHTRVRISAA